MVLRIRQQSPECRIVVVCAIFLSASVACTGLPDHGRRDGRSYAAGFASANDPALVRRARDGAVSVGELCVDLFEVSSIADVVRDDFVYGCTQALIGAIE